MVKIKLEKKNRIQLMNPNLTKEQRYYINERIRIHESSIDLMIEEIVEELLKENELENDRKFRINFTKLV